MVRSALAGAGPQACVPSRTGDHDPSATRACPAIKPGSRGVRFPHRRGGCSVTLPHWSPLRPSPARFPRTPCPDVGGEGGGGDGRPAPASAVRVGGAFEVGGRPSPRRASGRQRSRVRSARRGPRPGGDSAATARGGGAAEQGAGAKNTRRRRGGGGAAAAGLRSCGAAGCGPGKLYRARPAPLTDMLTFFLVSGGSLWLFVGKSPSCPRPLSPALAGWGLGPEWG